MLWGYPSVSRTGDHQLPVRRIAYHDLRQLLQHELAAEEDLGTANLIRRLRRVKRAGEFSRAEFLEMCRWKSPHALPHYRQNSAARIRRVSCAVLATRSERRRMELLTSLRGVSVPVASAILTLIDPRRYGVIDIRVWQLLYRMRLIQKHPKGRGFAVDDWIHYLSILRTCARKLKKPVRLIELTLFRYHRKVQRGRLYD